MQPDARSRSSLLAGRVLNVVGLDVNKRCLAGAAEHAQKVWVSPKPSPLPSRERARERGLENTTLQAGNPSQQRQGHRLEMVVFHPHLQFALAEPGLEALAGLGLAGAADRLAALVQQYAVAA